jgi:hypothetical protein
MDRGFSVCVAYSAVSAARSPSGQPRAASRAAVPEDIDGEVRDIARWSSG